MKNTKSLKFFFTILVALCLAFSPGLTLLAEETTAETTQQSTQTAAEQTTTEQTTTETSTKATTEESNTTTQQSTQTTQPPSQEGNMLMMPMLAPEIPGSSAANPVTDYAQLEAAVAAADSTDTIYIAAGTIAMSAQLSVDKNLTFIGAGQSATTLSNAAGVRHVMTTGTANVAFQGITFQGDGSRGGVEGDYNNSTFAFESCTFIDNIALGGGGVYGANITMTGCTVSNNYGTSFGGGGVYVTASGTFNNCTITGNNATGLFGGGGGVAGFGNAALQLTNCRITNNTTTQGGGGIQNVSGSLTLLQCTLSGNTASQDGGGLDANILTANGCTFSGNTTSNLGGGFHAQNTAQLTNCTVGGNNAKQGAGISASAALTLTNCTVSGNVATLTAGGISVISPGTLTMYGSIVSGNYLTSGTRAEVNTNNGTGTIANIAGAGGNNYIVGVPGGGLSSLIATTQVNIGGLKDVGALANNGGATQTIMINTSGIAYNAIAGSPYTIPSTDQRGVPRPVGNADIGSVEVQAGTPSTVVTFNGDTMETGTLRNAITAANALNDGTPVTFAPNMAGQTITLNSGLPNVGSAYDILGPSGGTTVQVSSNYRHFFISPFLSGTVTIENLNLQGRGVGQNGGGVQSFGQDVDLIMNNCEIMQNQSDYGAGIAAYNLELNDSWIHDNISTVIGLNTGGGGIYVVNATITDTVIQNNTAANLGGGVLAFTDLVMERSTVSGNTANNGGGGVFALDTSTLTDSTISNNSTSQQGGGIAGNTSTLTGCVLSGNSAGSGGGIYSSNLITAEKCTISGNQATGTDGGGGAFSNGSINATDCTISGNTSATYGGGLRGGFVTVVGSTLNGNTATAESGGGLDAWNTADLTNATVSGNWANGGGGGVSAGVSMSLTNCTVSGNQVNTGRGGGLYLPGTPTLNGSIVAANYKTNGTQDEFDNSTTTDNGNGAVTASGTYGSYYILGIPGGGLSTLMATTQANINGNKDVGLLADNGGDTQTIKITPGGIAQDTCVTSFVAIDQRNITRPQGDNNDIGAVELTYPTGITIDQGSIMGLLIGETEPLTVTLSPSDAEALITLAWSSSAPAIASVNPLTGQVTGVAQGAATITVSGPGTLSADITVEVRTIDYQFTVPFATFTGSGGSSGTVNADAAKFQMLIINGEPVDPSNFTIVGTGGNTVITLNESFLSTLPNGIYQVTAIFTDGIAEDVLFIVVQNNPNPSGGGGSGGTSVVSPTDAMGSGTGDAGLPLWPFIVGGIALVVLVVIVILNRKQGKKK